MSSHELEIIEFSIEPIKGSALGAYYGITEIDGKAYWNCCCINGKFLGADGLEFGTFAEMLKNPGDYFPFCCSYCGVSGCDNIFAPIRCKASVFFAKKKVLVNLAVMNSCVI